MVSFAGTISGQIIINISDELTRLICLRSNNGILVCEIDNNIKKTIFDLSKLIIGNSCSSFYENGISIDIISYCIIEGSNINYTSISKKVTIVDCKIQLQGMNMILVFYTDKEE